MKSLLSKLLILITLLGLVVTQGCDSPQYGIAVRNSTGQAIDDVTAQIGEAGMAPGAMALGALAETYPCRQAPGTTAVVSWRSEDGETHRAEAPVPQPMPRSFDGTLLVKIYGADKVQVVWIPKSESGRLWDDP